MQHYALFKSKTLDSVGVSVSTTRLLRYLLPIKYGHKNSHPEAATSCRVLV